MQQKHSLAEGWKKVNCSRNEQSQNRLLAHCSPGTHPLLPLRLPLKRPEVVSRKLLAGCDDPMFEVYVVIYLVYLTTLNRKLIA